MRIKPRPVEFVSVSSLIRYYSIDVPSFEAAATSVSFGDADHTLIHLDKFCEMIASFDRQKANRIESELSGLFYIDLET